MKLQHRFKALLKQSKYLPFLVVIATTQLAGCANLGVQPWERDLLAQDEMALKKQSTTIIV